MHFQLKPYCNTLLSSANYSVLSPNVRFALHEENFYLFSSIFLILMQCCYNISNRAF